MAAKMIQKDLGIVFKEVVSVVIISNPAPFVLVYFKRYVTR